MTTKVNIIWLSDKLILFLFMASMLLPRDVIVADFPVYSLLLFLAAFSWVAVRIFLWQKDGQALRPVRYWTDIMAAFVVFYEVASIVRKLFQDSGQGVIDFSGNAEALAFVALYFCLSSGIRFRQLYFDMLLYGGLLLCAVFLFPYFTGIPVNGYGTLQSGGAAASCFLLVCMVGVYQYCFCRDRLRSCFYLAVSVVGFLALFVNQNIVSFWLMTAYFIAVPVLLRPTAYLVKKNAQMFFLFGFMLSNMSLLTEYTQIFLAEFSYSLEHSVYLDLLLAAGGIFFFHYWDKIPEGVDLERLVMRKMRRVYKGLLMALCILFAGTIIGADRWAALGEKMSDEAWRGFALPLAESVRYEESGFYLCFREAGAGTALFVIVFLIFLMERLRRNYGLDKPMTGILTLIAVIFMVQMLFWKPAANTLTIYFMLLLFAAFQKEERPGLVSIKIRGEALKGRGMKKC
ncbi:MAG: hypothetical protein NC341_10035 [Blautia sp.]|nr:hypothetical protein [Blautia sp.]MCM1201837.1 hypothetical protein [Bacteroides fragilis]